MPYIQAIVLGLIQGLTEFIPVSSSGHLVLVRELFGWEDTGVAFDAILHLGTLLAVLIYFWATWKALFRTLGIMIMGIFQRTWWAKISKPETFLLGALALGTVPAVIAGYFLRDIIDETFRDITWVAIFLMVTGILYLIVERSRRFFKHQEEAKGSPEYGTTKFENLSWWQVLFIGVMQAIALLPGASRSGFTISGGVFSGLTRESSARFAFLLAAPVILAAGILGIIDIVNNGLAEIGAGAIIVGFLVASVAGYFAVRSMLKFLRVNKLYIFSIYLFVLAIIIFYLSR